jgi:uncharacterized membrane protein YdfJ with MMPL/SSD domain
MDFFIIVISFQCLLLTCACLFPSCNPNDVNDIDNFAGEPSHHHMSRGGGIWAKAIATRPSLPLLIVAAVLVSFIIYVELSRAGQSVAAVTAGTQVHSSPLLIHDKP